jgi:hypothetical protein
VWAPGCWPFTLLPNPPGQLTPHPALEVPNFKTDPFLQISKFRVRIGTGILDLTFYKVWENVENSSTGNVPSWSPEKAVTCLTVMGRLKSKQNSHFLEALSWPRSAPGGEREQPAGKGAGRTSWVKLMRQLDAFQKEAGATSIPCIRSSACSMLCGGWAKRL